MVTIDAGCETEIASRVRERGGHYTLAVRGNQPKVETTARGRSRPLCRPTSLGCPTSAESPRRVGQHEEQYMAVIYGPTGWSDVATMFVVSRERRSEGYSSGSATTSRTTPGRRPR